MFRLQSLFKIHFLEYSPCWLSIFPTPEASIIDCSQVIRKKNWFFLLNSIKSKRLSYSLHKQKDPKKIEAEIEV